MKHHNRVSTNSSPLTPLLWLKAPIWRIQLKNSCLRSHKMLRLLILWKMSLLLHKNGNVYALKIKNLEVKNTKVLTKEFYVKSQVVGNKLTTPANRHSFSQIIKPVDETAVQNMCHNSKTTPTVNTNLGILSQMAQ